MEWAFRIASEVCRNPSAAVSRWKMLTGRKAVGCIPIYVPEEVLHAAGILPVTIWGNEFPHSSRRGIPPFVCSVAGGVVSAIRSGKWGEIDAWVFPSTCDTFQNAFEVLFPPEIECPRFPFVFPASSEIPGATEYMLDRMEVFREWAGEISGREVSEGALERAIGAYNENLQAFGLLEKRMRDSPGSFSGVELFTLARAGMVLPRDGHTKILVGALSRSREPSRKTRAKVFLTGMMPTEPVMEAIDAAGAAIVGNDLALGHRYYSGPADETGDMLLSLARRHLRRDPCSTLHGFARPRIEELFRRFDDSGADRLLLLRMRQCEPESGDIPDMAEPSRDRGIPFLHLDIDLQAEEAASAKTRIEAFVEMRE
ncbi:MAG: 2-hydroxyacyl-CoA dehydratase [Deltaproteobacteria bacterium]|nr:2-hydroxyacyl-CoA dehydratase [Deltaproteobacteria bacterium]NNG46999.1 2-hydroxyacyl-CoA dehydratase [Deltaproteobacteria bacterium]